MSLLKKHETEPDTSSSDEEFYQKLFTKIGRDFVYKEDLEDYIRYLISQIGLSSFTRVKIGDIKAKSKALEYKKNIESGKIDSSKYKDLINLDD